MNNGKIGINRKPLDLSELLTQLTEEMYPVFEKSKLTARLEGAEADGFRRRLEISSFFCFMSQFYVPPKRTIVGIIGRIFALQIRKGICYDHSVPIGWYN